MKLFLYISLLFLPFLGLSQTFKFSLVGSISNADNGRNEPGVVISIIQNGNTIATTTTASNGSFSLVKSIDVKSPFKIVISKPQFVSKFIQCDFSKLNGEARQGGNEVNFPLNGSIFANKPGIDFSFLDTEPIMNWTVESSGEPELDQGQFKATKKKIDALLKQVEDQEKNNKKEYQKVMAEANALFNSSKFEEALPKYEQASQLLPREEEPIDKIDAIEKILLQRKKDALAAEQANAAYNNKIKEADALRDQKQYDQAIAKYQEAQSLSASSTYPGQQINIINGLKKDQANEQKFKELVAQADGFFKQKSWKAAQEKYALAKKIHVDDAYVNEQLAKIQTELDKASGEKAKKEKYDQAIIAADAARDQKQYELAVTKYKEALALESASTYAAAELKKAQAAFDAEKAAAEKLAKVQKLLSEGAVLVTSKKYLEAKAKYNEVIGLDNQNAEAIQKLADIKALEDEAKNASVQEQKFNKFVADGTAAEKVNNLTEAQTNYEAALDLKKDPSVQAKLDGVKKKIQEQSAAAEKAKLYQAAMDQANALAADKKYIEAKAAYQKASNIDQSQELPKTKIREIDDFIAKQDAEMAKAAQFNQLLSDGQNLRNAKKYTEAREKYVQAQALDKVSSIPAERIKEIDDLIAKDKADAAKKVQIEKWLVEGNDLLAKNDLTNAKSTFLKVLAEDPENKIAIEKRDLIDQKLAAQQGEAEKKKQFEKIKKEGFDLAKEGKNEQAKSKLEEAKNYGSDAELIAKIDELTKLIQAEQMKKGLDEQYQSVMQEAQNLEQAQKLQDAIAKYKAASQLKPDKTEPTQKIAELQKRLNDNNKQADIDRRYQAFMAKGDEYMAKQEYVKAIQEYNAANAEKPSEKEPIDKANEAERLSKSMNQEADILFERMVQAAQKSLDEGDIEKAIERAENAKKTRPSDPRPQEILNQIEYLQKSNKIYQTFMKEGADLEKSKKYSEAMRAYQNALGAKSKDQLALDKISEMQQLIDKESNASLSALQKQKRYGELVQLADKEFKDGTLPVAKAKYENILMEFPGDGYANDQINKIESLLNPVVQEVGPLQDLGDPYDNSITDGQAALRQAENQRKHYNAAVLTQTKNKLFNADTSQINTDDQSIKDNMKNYQDVAFTNDSLHHRGDVHRFNNVDSVNAIRIRQENAKAQSDQFKYNENLNSQEALNQIHVNETDDSTYAASNYSFLKDETHAQLYNANKESNQKDQEEAQANVEVIRTSEDYKSELAQTRAEALQENTATLHESKRVQEDNDVQAYNSEMTKYLKNKMNIESGEKNRLSTAEEEKNKNQANTAKINTIKEKTHDAHLGDSENDDQIRLNTKNTLNEKVKEVDENNKASTKKQNENSEHIKEINKQKLANDKETAELHKGKQTNNKQLIDKVDDGPKEKVRTANTLGEEYPEGVTEEKFMQKDTYGLLKAIITRRVVVIKGEGIVYVKTETTGGTTYSKNGSFITEQAWIAETQDASLERHTK